jgi:hypothetical protein
MQSQSQREARKRAQKEAEDARRRAVMREAGIKSQAEQMATAGLMRPSTAQQNISVQSSPGFIGQNLPTNAGTF